MDYVLYEMSYANLILYSSSLPSYKSKADKKKKVDSDEEVIKADDPRNKEKVAAFFRSVE